MKNLISAAVAVMGVVLSVAAGRLPAEYTEVEYLKGGGGAYINLGTKFTEKDRVDIAVMIDVNETAMIFGSRTSSAANDCFIWGLDSSGTKCSLDFRNITSPNRLQYVQAGLVGLKLKVVDSAEQRGYYNYDTDEVLAESTSAASGTFTTPQNAYLFWASGNVWSQNKFSGKVYSFTVSTNGVNRIELVPVVRISDSVAGLYDLVSGTFLVNAGSGAFTAGPLLLDFAVLPIPRQRLMPGDASEPTVTVSNLATGATCQLDRDSENADLEISYSNNTGYGIGTATITGKNGGAYEGQTVSVDFQITSYREVMPAGYTEVEYIQGNGTDARIILGYAPNPHTDKLAAEVEFTRSGVGETVWCTRGNKTNSGTWTLFKLDTNHYRFDYYNSTAGDVNAPPALNTRYTLTVEDNVFSSSSGARYSSYARQNSFTSTGGPLVLFASYYNGIGNNKGSWSTHRLYSFKVWREGTLIHYYVPCLDPAGRATLLDICDEPDTTLTVEGMFTAGPAGDFCDPALLGDITLVPIEDQKFDGEALTPSVIVSNVITHATWTVGGDAESEFFDIAYANNNGAARASVTVTGKADTAYEGMMTRGGFAVYSIIHAMPDGAGEANGRDWANAMTFTNAISAAAASACRCEVWVAGTNWLTAGRSPTFTHPTAIRGGFVGTETALSQRKPGAKSVLDGNRSIQILNFSNGAAAPVVLDSLVFTRGYLNNVIRSGAGDLTITNCDFTCCKGDRMYTSGNNSGCANRNYGGAGAHLGGSSPSVLRVYDSSFSGNQCAGGEWNGAGVGCWVSGFTRAEFTDTTVVTNTHTVGRNGRFACAMQINNVPSHFRRCSFRGNYSDSGDFLHLNGNCGGTVFENCDFVGNRGGGSQFVGVSFSNGDDTAAFTNCTFAYNHIASSSMIRGGKGQLTVHNSIFHRNYALNSSLVGIDISLAAACTGRVDYCAFDGTTPDYLSDTTSDSLILDKCIIGADPKFVTSSETFRALVGSDSKPRIGSYGVAVANTWNLDVHLMSSEGYYNNAGELLTADAVSAFVDAGDRADGGWVNEPAPNGGRINLGAYGGTDRASCTVACDPAVNPATIAVAFPNEYTQPQIAFTMGGEGVYSKNVTVSIWSGGEEIYSESGFAGLTNGQEVAFLAGYYCPAGSFITVKIAIEDVDGTFDIPAPVEVQGVVPPWDGKGGGEHVIHLRAGATGRNTGENWTDAFTDYGVAIDSMKNGKTELWIAGDISITAGKSKTFTEAGAIRGGFTGAENTPEERQPGLRSKIDGNSSCQILSFSNASGIPVTLDGVLFTRGYLNNVIRSGAGDLTITNCGFTCCNGERMYTYGNNSGYANRNYGGAGAHLGGSSPSVLRVYNSSFSGNQCAGGEWNGAGVGCWVSGFSRAEFTDTSVITNNHTAGRNGRFACAMQINSVPCHFRRCSFRGNYSDSGDFLNLNGNCGGTVFENCDFVGNRTGAGPLLYPSLSSADDTVAVTNCTFAFNYNATSSAIRTTKGRLLVHNSIFHQNYAGSTSVPGVDISLGDTATARVDYSAFDNLTSDYLSETEADTLEVVECLSENDPLFVTTTTDFQLLLNNSNAPKVGSFSISQSQLWNLDVHLMSSEGYFNNAGEELTADVLSPMIDKGNEDDPGWVNEPSPNGGRINLGVYGGTAQASKTPYAAPAIEGDVSIGFGEYSQPTISFTAGGVGTYSADVYVTVYTNNVQVWQNPVITGITNGMEVAFMLPRYYVPGTMMKAVIQISASGNFDVANSDEFEVTGELPPWYGKGGGANVVHLRAGATGLGDGTSWSDAFTDLNLALAAMNNVKTELWIAGKYDVTSTRNLSFTTESAIRGGFTGVENTAEERVPGAKATLDGNSSCVLISLSNGAGVPVTLDGLIITRGYRNNIRRSGAGDLILTNCDFTCCWGNTMYNGNNAGNGNRNFGGAGAQLSGSSPAVLKVYGCSFAGNFSKDGEWNGSGVGCWMSGFSRAEFTDTIVTTNSQTYSRNHMMACAMQINSVPCSFRRCAFRGNSSSSGDFIHLNGNCGGTVFENCEFVGNRTGEYPFLRVSLGAIDRTVAFTNCTFAYNYSGSSATIYAESGEVTVHNTVFHRNYVSTSSTKGADIALVTADAKGLVDYTCFDGLTTNYVSEVTENSLDLGTGVFAADARLGSDEAFAVLLNNENAPKVSSFTPSAAALRSLDVHLKSRAGRIDETTGKVIRYRGKASPAIDAGDPADDYSAEPDIDQIGTHGRRINLGAYGNTPQATFSPLKGNALKLR